MTKEEKERLQKEVEKIMQSELYEFICSKVNSFRTINYEKIYTASRKRVHVEPRQLILYFLKKHTNYTLTLLGLVVNRDHATVLHSSRTVIHMRDTDKSWTEFVDQADLDIAYFVRQKSKNKTTKFSLFKELIGNLVHDEILRKEWMQAYLNAKS